MPLSAFALILLAGVIHASWNIAAKKANGDARFAFQRGVLMMLVWTPVDLALGWRVLPQWRAMEWAFVVVSGVLHVVYYVTLLRGYRKSDLTVVYPLARGSGPLLSSLVAILFLGERISLIGMAGVVGVVLGVFLLVLYAVQQAPISHMAPAREVSMLFAALIGGLLLREGDRVWRLVGACFIAVGVIALALG